MRCYIQLVACILLLISTCHSKAPSSQDGLLVRRGGSGSRSPSPHREGSTGTLWDVVHQGSKGKTSAHSKSSGSANPVQLHAHHAHPSQTTPQAAHPGQTHPAHLSAPRPVHLSHTAHQAYPAHPSRPTQTYRKHSDASLHATPSLSKQSVERLTSSIPSAGSRKRPAPEASSDAKSARLKWWQVPGGKAKPGPVAGDKTQWWNKPGGRPRLPAGSGPNYESKKAYAERAKALKKQKQGFPPSEHHEHHPKPGGPRGPGSPGAGGGAHFVSKRKLRFN